MVADIAAMNKSINTHVIITLDSVDKGLISHNLSFTIEESLKTLFDGLELLLAYLKEAQKQTHRV